LRERNSFVAEVTARLRRAFAGATVALEAAPVDLEVQDST
jgi:hypothetical protein